MESIKSYLEPLEEKVYFNNLNHYLNNELLKSRKNPKNPYFRQLKKDLQEIISEVNETKSINLAVINPKFERRAIKYVDMLESYKLVKYQFSKYSNTKKSLCEGVYSAIALEAVRNIRNLNENIRIADIGCGPSRFAYEMTDLFPNANLELYDFSITNLFLARKLLCSGKDVNIPTRNINQFEETKEPDIKIIKIPAKQSQKVSFHLCNLNKKIPLKDNSYDLLNSTHCINLLNSPDRIISDLVKKLKKNGILIISDLLGWKEDRPLDKRTFPDGVQFYNFLSNINEANLLSYWYGGPYIEEFNSERQDVYINHTAILKKL